jgi:hypothetical protein
MRKVSQCLAVMLFATAVSGGCATQSSTETVKKETVQYPAEQAQYQRTTEKSETTKTEENSGGVLSSSVNIVGDVLALPFRAVAGLFEVLF